MYISLPTDSGAEGQLPDEWVMDNSATRQIFANMAESSDTLENLVFHQVCLGSAHVSRHILSIVR
jgi:hypothetical protein